MPDAVVKDPVPFETWRFLRFLKQEILELEARDLQPKRTPPRAIPLFQWTWSFPWSRTTRRTRLRFHPKGAGYYGDVDVDYRQVDRQVHWVFDWTNMGGRPSTLARVRSGLRAHRGQLAPGIDKYGEKGSLKRRFKMSGELNRSAAAQVAREVYEFLTNTFDFYDSCGLWDDPYDAFAKPS